MHFQREPILKFHKNVILVLTVLLKYADEFFQEKGIKI